MNYAEIKFSDIANGPGVRTSLFVSGCRHHCPECFNPEAWSFQAGEPFTPQVEDRILESLRPAWIAGLTLLGGEPMEQETQQALLPFLQRVRREVPGKTIWCFSGFTWEQLTGREPSRALCDTTAPLLSQLDVLVDGPFLIGQKDISLRFRGSCNQRLLDVPASLNAGQPVEWIDEKVYSTHTMD